MHILSYRLTRSTCKPNVFHQLTRSTYMPIVSYLKCFHAYFILRSYESTCMRIVSYLQNEYLELIVSYLKHLHAYCILPVIRKCLHTYCILPVSRKYLHAPLLDNSCRQSGRCCAQLFVDQWAGASKHDLADVARLLFAQSDVTRQSSTTGVILLMNIQNSNKYLIKSYLKNKYK